MNLLGINRGARDKSSVWQLHFILNTLYETAPVPVPAVLLDYPRAQQSFIP